jgi:hypothetical protein
VVDASVGGPETGGGPITIQQLAGIPNNFSESFMSSFMLFPCYAQAAQDCSTIPAGTACTNQGNNAIPMEQRGLVTHNYFTLGGTRGTNYAVTLNVAGITEGKYYQGGTRSAGNTAIANVNDPNGLNTFYTGGAPVDAEFYNVYKLIVRNPPAAGAAPQTGTEVQHYYLNSFPVIAGQNAYEQHNSFPIRIVTDGVGGNPAPIVVPGGGVIEYLLNDSNCRAIDNCGPGSLGTVCTSTTAPRRIPGEPNLAVPASYMGQATSGLNTVNGATQPFHAQILHITVTNVTTM